MEKPEKKVAVVTGGSQGIGRAIALAFAKKGHLVCICARTAKDVRRTAREISGLGYKCRGFTLDVSKASQIRRTVDSIVRQYGRIDVLVTCAGVYGPLGPLEENVENPWAEALSINVLGTVYAVRSVLPVMKRQGKGCIITMAGAGAGGSNIKPNLSCYTASKFAICGFTESVSKELERTGVRINAISPGAVNTRLIDQVLAAGEKSGKEFLRESIRQKQAGGTSPEAAASLAIYLASGQASHLNGKILSAIWEKPEFLSAMRGKVQGSIYNLRRIDGVIYCEKPRKK